jgi:hypothetical protein
MGRVTLKRPCHDTQGDLAIYELDGSPSQRRRSYRLSRDNFHVAQASSTLSIPVTIVRTPIIKFTLVSTETPRDSRKAVDVVLVSSYVNIKQFGVFGTYSSCGDL